MPVRSRLLRHHPSSLLINVIANHDSNCRLNNKEGRRRRRRRRRLASNVKKTLAEPELEEEDDDLFAMSEEGEGNDRGRRAGINSGTDEDDAKGLT